MMYKKMLIVFGVMLSFLLTTNVYAQFLDLKGLTIQAVSTEDVIDGEKVAGKCDQTYNVSFTDKFLVHNVYKDGQVDASQIYTISDLQKYTDEGNTIFKFTATSGISGNFFYYKIIVTEAGKLKAVVLTQMDKSVTSYFGGVSELRTFKQ